MAGVDPAICRRAVLDRMAGVRPGHEAEIETAHAIDV